MLSETAQEKFSTMNSKEFRTACSRIEGFAKMNAEERVAALCARGLLPPEWASSLLNTGALARENAESFIENCIGGFTLPLGLATNFLINNIEVFLPMAVEESSVVAAASHGAKLARAGGGFIAEPTKAIATAQVQFYSQLSFEVLQTRIENLNISELCKKVHPNLEARGGGFCGLELRECDFQDDFGRPLYFVLHLHVNTVEAMGANIVNSLAEEVGKILPLHFECKVGLKILTNLTTKRLTKVSCKVPFSALQIAGFSGEDAAKRIVKAYEFAATDVFRAATHNKGIMNGIDPVVIATGNDWRAVEAGAHAYASITGRYKPLTNWRIQDNFLCGTIEIPIAIGTVGGVTKLHPTARLCLSLLGFPTSSELSGMIASVGLAQNLSALRALACEGIQKGHMALHEKNQEMLRMYDVAPALKKVPL